MVLPLLLVFALVAGACSSGDSDSDTARAPQTAIEAALAPQPVTFVPDGTASDGEELDQRLSNGDAIGVVRLGEPVLDDGRWVIISAQACGSLCGTGGRNVVEWADGRWTVGTAVGGGWEA